MWYKRVVKPTTRFATSLPLLFLTACSGTPDPASPARPGSGGETAAAQAPAAEPFARALDAALARGSWRELRIESECRDDAGDLRSAELFGTGVGIWNRERQFAVPRERLLGVLEAARRAGFGAMPESFGGKGAPKMRLEMICRVQIALDGEEKQSYQLSEGRQSPELEELAGRILAVAAELGPSGVAASSLDDGLDKIARGELAPEALTLQLQRQAEDPEAAEGGWILRIEDGGAQVSFYTPAGGWTEPRYVRLSPEEAAGLARQLAAARPEDLPGNLYSTWYQDLEIRVLNRRKALQARRFASLTPETHGERQKRFDRIIAALEALQERVAGSRQNQKTD